MHQHFILIGSVKILTPNHKAWLIWEKRPYSSLNLYPDISFAIPYNYPGYLSYLHTKKIITDKEFKLNLQQTYYLINNKTDWETFNLYFNLIKNLSNRKL